MFKPSVALSIFATAAEGLKFLKDVFCAEDGAPVEVPPRRPFSRRSGSTPRRPGTAPADMSRLAKAVAKRERRREKALALARRLAAA